VAAVQRAADVCWPFKTHAAPPQATSTLPLSAAPLARYLNWTIGKPAVADLTLPELCYKGLLHVNISCIAPAPSPPTAR
jgi:hypothetical protein